MGKNGRFRLRFDFENIKITDIKGSTEKDFDNVIEGIKEKLKPFRRRK